MLILNIVAILAALALAQRPSSTTKGPRSSKGLVPKREGNQPTTSDGTQPTPIGGDQPYPVEGIPTSSPKGKPKSSAKGKQTTPVKGKPTSSVKGKPKSSVKGKPTSSGKGKPKSSVKGKPTSSAKGRKPTPVNEGQPVPANSNQPIPEKGITDDLGGLFGINLITIDLKSIPANILGGLVVTGPESSKTVKASLKNLGGTGPYKATFKADPSLPNHTIYAPKMPPKGVKMPVVIFGNGLCMNQGGMYSEFLNEIASYGYLVIANGPPTGGTGAEKSIQMVESINWAMKNEDASSYGMLDLEKIASTGLSCGGLDAYSASYHDPRVKLTVIYNVGVFDQNRRYLIKELKTPVGWFLGGPRDAGYELAKLDYNLLSPELPAVLASLDAGHMGTFSAQNGGKYGRAAVSFLEWQFRGNETAKKRFVDPKSPRSLVSERWNVTMKNIS